MSKTFVGWTMFYAGVTCSSLAWGQAKAGGGLSLSTENGAQASASSTSSTEAPPFEPYAPGYPPEGNLLELGVFGGVIIPSKDHHLLDERFQRGTYKLGPEVGGRLGYYPLSFVGLEGEAMGALSKVDGGAVTQLPGAGDGRGGGLYALRAHLVLQAPLAYFVPFALGGVGRLGAISQAMGKDSDVAWHVGLGAKIPLGPVLALRLEGRDNLTAKVGGDGQAHSFEAQLGLTAVLGRTRREPPPPPADNDHDGVPDGTDQCPAEAGAFPSGCPADTDSDGVLDKDDYCPREVGSAPKGCPIVDLDPDKDSVPLPCDLCPKEPGVKLDGCPIRDKDGDGIFDDKDKCIDVPETKNGFEDDDGCPDKLPEKVKKFTGVVEGIYFDQGKATVRKQSAKTLDAAVKVLQEFPSVSMEISGHTSSEGDKAFNDKLSQERADAVKQWLVDKGVSPARIKTRGAGSSESIADNKTAAGRGKNRRIEFKIIE